RGAYKKGGSAEPPLHAWFVKTGLLLLQRQAAETLVELSHAAALIDLARAASPRRVAGRIDVERQRVAFAAPGGARLEHGAVGHLHLDHVVVGVNVGLHGGTSFVHEAGSDRPGNVGKGARLQSCAADCNSLSEADDQPAFGPSATMAVNCTSQVTLSLTLALPQNLQTRARFWTKPTRRSSRQPGSTGARNLASSIAMK